MKQKQRNRNKLREYEKDTVFLRRKLRKMGQERKLLVD